MEDIAAHAGISPGFKLIGDGRMPDTAQYSARLGENVRESAPLGCFCNPSGAFFQVMSVKVAIR
jgi:hypothetical protein